MTGGTALLDVNVPMYAGGRDHPLKDPCAWVMSQIVDDGFNLVIDAEIIQEILYRYTHLRQWNIGVRMAASLLDLVPSVLPVTERDARVAVELFEAYAPQGISPRDLIHAAVMQNHDINTIVSTDRHFDVIDGVNRLDPRDLYAQAQPDAGEQLD